MFYIKKRKNCFSSANHVPFCYLAICLFCLCFLQASVSAFDEGTIDDLAEEETDMLGDDITGGFVVDQTITLIAHEFYQHFVKFWRELPAAEHNTLIIYERPTARWGSIVRIEHNNRVVFRANLFSARSKTEAVAQMAANAINQQLENVELQKSIFSNPDLDF